SRSSAALSSPRARRIAPSLRGRMATDHEIVPYDPVLRVEAQRRLPALERPLPIVLAVVQVAESGIDIVAQFGGELDRSAVMLERVVVGAAAIGEVAQILLRLRQRRVLFR